MEVKIFNHNKKPDTKVNFIANGLPKPKNGALRWILLGPTGSGKSNIIKNVLYHKEWRYVSPNGKGYFDEVYAFMGSLDDVEELKQLTKKYRLEDTISVHNEYDDNLVRKLYRDIEEENSQLISEGKEPSRVLFIFDDQVCNNLSRIGKLTCIDRIFIQGRHAFISTIISTQKAKMLNQNMRVLNVSHFTVFHGTNSYDLNTVSQEHNGNLTPDEFRKILNEQAFLFKIKFFFSIV
jgi:hypothetical protein